MFRTTRTRSAIATSFLLTATSFTVPLSAAGAVLTSPATATDPATPTRPIAPAVTPSPTVIDGRVADVLVRIEGDGVCSGTPIADSRYVVTAAHCVLDEAGNVGPRTVVRDGIRYEAVEVLVDVRYSDAPTNALDAAVLVMDREIPGPAATIGETLPTTGTVTVAGFQSVDADGKLLRGTTPHDRPAPVGATGGLVIVGHEPAGCSVAAASLEVSAESVRVRCGLIPGASGGGLYLQATGSVQLVAIISTVSPDITSNGLTPLSSLTELLARPDRFTTSLAGMRTVIGPPPEYA